MNARPPNFRKVGGAHGPRLNLGDDSDSEGEKDAELEAFLKAKRESAGASEAEIEKAKMAHFTGVTAKKSKYQREKEEAERKKKDEEEAAAKAFAEFVEAMDGDGGRGGPAAKSKPKGFVSAGGSQAYVPTRQAPSGPSSGPPIAPRAMLGGGPSKKSLSMFGDDEEEPEKPAKKEPPGKRKRAMDEFLSQLQRDQAEREERLRSKVGEGTSISSLIALEGQKIGSRDLGDPLTSNLCVQNLPANISEAALGDFFCQWGDIGTVKIMWPRGEDFSLGGAGAGITGLRNQRSAGLTGFVSFMRREDAEYALKESDGITWGGSLIRTGWGKAMPIPGKAAYTMPVNSRRERQRSRSHSPKRRRSRSPSARRRRENRSPSPRSVVRVQVEKDEANEKFIRTVASRVQEHGPRFEAMIREKERENPRFAFLRDDKLPEYHFFKMCLDERYRPPTPEPDRFEDEGNASLQSTDSEEESEAERLRKLRRDVIGHVARKRLEAMLRGITPRRERIAKCMAFAIEHAYAADPIAQLLCESLKLPATPVPRKIARLHAISDILHNSACPVPNAWKYRNAFESRLPSVFEHLGAVARSFPGRMKAEGFKRLVLNVLECWETWLVFPPSTLEMFHERLNAGAGNGNGGAQEMDAETGANTVSASLAVAAPSTELGAAGFKAAGFRPAAAAAAGAKEEVDGAPIVEDVDGEAIDEEVIDDLDGEMM